VRHEGGLVLATLIRTTGDFDLAEDAVQDAALAALEAWPRDGVPDNPGAWLTTVARRRALDRIRRETTRRAKEHQAATWLLDDESPSPPGHDSMVGDDVLRLVFTCCHPALSSEAQVALTLRAVCGLATRDIAAVFMVPEPTMGQRISRAKKKIAVARIVYRVPPDHELPDRLAAVLAVIYLIFTTGHHAPSGPGPVRADLAAEAIRLARLVVQLLPDDAEAAGLLALLLATHARAPARLDDRGDVVLLADQDRSRWDRTTIGEASALIERALHRRRPGPYQVQAAIACLHGLAPTWSATDWPQILELYDLLAGMQPTPVVRLNRAVAIAEVHGPAAALRSIDELGGLATWHLYWSTRAGLLRQLGRSGEAADAFRRALACEANDADRRFLCRRLQEMESDVRP
jgi:RNA polymerase sigma-70 factor, ECF subfamily